MNNQTQDRTVSDQNFADITDFNFTQKVFQSNPSIRSIKPDNGYFVSKPYKGESYDKSEFMLVEQGWNHEHCSFCYYKIEDTISYWGNSNDVIILCEQCYNHYKDKIKHNSEAEQEDSASSK